MHGEKKENILPISLQENHLAMVTNQMITLEERVLMYKKQLKKAGDEQVQWIVDITHQLKTPLSGLKLYTEMGDSQEKQLELIEQIEMLITALIKLEKLYVNAYDFAFENLEVEKIIEKTKKEISQLYPYVNMNIRGKGKLFADGYWLEEAIKNILKNSCEHSRQEGVVQINITQTIDVLTITIEDEGGGLEDEEIPKLFCRFFKSKKNTNPNSMGVGLAIAKEIVNKHQGEIKGENTLTGLKITISFYLHQHLLTKL